MKVTDKNFTWDKPHKIVKRTKKSETKQPLETPKTCDHEWKVITVNGYPSRDKNGYIMVRCTKCKKYSRGGK